MIFLFQKNVTLLSLIVYSLREGVGRDMVTHVFKENTTGDSENDFDIEKWYLWSIT